MDDIPLIIFTLVLLLVLDLLVLAARVAFNQTSHGRLLALRETLNGRVSRTIALLPSLPRLNASLSLLLVFTRFLFAGLVFLILERTAAPQVLWFQTLTLLIAALLLFILEWVTSRAISRSPDNFAIRFTPFVRALIGLLSPLVMLSFGLARESQNPVDLTGKVTEDELKTLVDAGQEEGVFEQDERRMIYSIFRLGETLAREIMVPRIDMLALDVNTPIPVALEAFIRSGHSRVPVYEESVDRTLGVLYAKDLLRVWREGKELSSLRSLLRPAYFVPEAKRVDDLLAEMQSQRIHIAIIVDEYGGVAGLVTLEDIVEEIVGEIQDEYDQGEELPYQVLSNGEYQFLGRVDMDDFNEIMSVNLPKDEADTLGGFIYSHLGHVPEVGEEVQAGENLILTVEQVTARRIRKVRARRVQAQVDSNEVDGNANG